MSDTKLSEREEPNQSIESIIRAAGQYVQPSEDLRPRTLEAAREQCGDRRAERHLGNFVIAMMVLVLVGSPIVSLIKFAQSSSSSVSATEMEQKALIYAAQPGVGTNWGLSEAFTQMRDVQASQLGRKTR
jgi:hypothetical protein